MLDGKTAEEVFLQDFKVFMCGDIRFGVAQGSYMTRKNLLAAEALLQPYLEEARNKQNVEDIYMLLTDVPKEESVVISDGRYASEVLSDGFETQPAEDGSFTLPGVVSRKNAVHPGADDRLSGAVRCLIFCIKKHRMPRRPPCRKALCAAAIPLRAGAGGGFRYRARYAAQTLELTGWVENEDDGSVTLEVQGDPEKFLRLFAMIQKSDYIQITGIRQKDLPPDPWERGFSVKGY